MTYGRMCCRFQDMNQTETSNLNLLIDQELHRRFKAAAAAAGLKMSDVVRELLAMWLAGKVKIPAKKA